MSSFPAANYLSNAGRTEAEMKTAFEDWLATTKQIPLAAVAFSTLTIASGSITPTSGQGHYKVESEGGASQDDLTHIVQTNIPDGAGLLLRSGDAGHVIIVKGSQGGAGQIILAPGTNAYTDAVGSSIWLPLYAPDQWILLRRNGNQWDEVMRSWGQTHGYYRLFVGLGHLPVYKGANLTAASTMAIGFDGDFFHVTGNTTITALDSGKTLGTRVTLVFDGTPQLTHSASLILASGGNEVMVAGQVKTFVCENSNGTWRDQGPKIPAPNAPDILYKSGTVVTIANTVSETDVISVTIPGNKLGSHGRLRVTLWGDLSQGTNSSVDYQLKAKYGATTIVDSGQVRVGSASTGVVGPLKIVIEIANTGATNAQRGAMEWYGPSMSVGSDTNILIRSNDGGGTSTPGVTNRFLTGSAAEDSTADKTLAVSFKWSAASVNITMSFRHMLVEVIA